MENRLFINLLSTDYKDSIHRSGSDEIESGIEGVRFENTFRQRIILLPGEDEIISVYQRSMFLWNRFPGLSSHDAQVVKSFPFRFHGQVLEILHIARNSPGQLIIDPDASIQVTGDDDIEPISHGNSLVKSNQLKQKRET